MAKPQQGPAADASSGQGSRGVLRRTLVNTGILLSGRVVEGLLALPTMALTVRTLGMDAFGALSLITVFAATVGQLVHLKLGAAILTYGAPRLEGNDESGFRDLIGFAVRLELIATAFGVLLSGALAFWLGPLFGWPESLGGVATAYMAVVAFQTRGRVARGTLRLFRRFDLIAVTRSSETLVQLLGASVLWLKGADSVVAFLGVWFLAAVVRGLGMAFAAYLELRARALLPSRLARQPAGRAIANGLWRFIGVTNLNKLIVLPPAKLGTLLVGASLGTAQTGLFQIGARIAEAVTPPVRSMQPAIGPELAHLLASGEQRRLNRLIIRAAAIAAATATICLVALAFAGRTVLDLLGGSAAQSAYVTMLLIATASLGGASAFPLRVLLNAAAKPGWITASNLANTLAYVGAFFALVAPLGIEAAGVAAIGAITCRLAIEGIGTWSLTRERPTATDPTMH